MINFIKKNWLCLLVGFVIAYACTYGFYVLSSQGLTQRPLMLQMRRFMPIAFLMTFTYAYLRDKVHLEYWFTFTLVAVAWITVYPVCYHVTYASTVPSFGWHFDILLGAMSWVGLALLAYSLLIFLGARITTILITVIEFLLLIIPLEEIFYFWIYKSCISQAAIMAVMQTNYLEAKEYLTGVIGYPMLLCTSFIYIALACILYKCNVNCFSTIKPVASKKAVALVMCALCVLGYGLPHGLRGSGFGDIVYDAYYYFKDLAEFKTRHANTLADLKVTLPAKRMAKPHTIVFVIGESASRHFMSAFYETERDTTPWLRSQKNNPDFTLFNHAYASWGQTVPALERALTEKNQYNEKEFKDSATIIDIAKAAGYKTYWFSNQTDIDDADTPITLVGRTADVAKWTNADAKAIKYDGSLLAYLQEIDPQKNNFVVLHLMGSHAEFKYRYPKEFTQWGDYAKSNLILEHSNSLYYTDWVLKKTYEYANNNLNLQAMIYFSDHGCLPDHKRHPDETGFKHLSVPFFCYLGDEYQRTYPEIAKIIKKHEQSYFTNDLMYDFICGLLNVKSNRYDEANSIASDKYKWNRQTLRTALGKKKLTEDVNP